MPDLSDALTITTPTERQILLTRELDAPKHLVWKAWTTPALVRRWWSGRRGEMTVCEIDLRVGGSWRYAMIANGEFEVAFNGVFREIVEHERIVQTEIYEAMGGDGVINTITFTEAGGRTTVELLTDCRDQAERDAILSSGFEVGVREQMELVEQLARELAADGGA